MVTDTAVVPTCTEIGYTAGIYCTSCQTWLSGHEEIPAFGHDLGEWTVTSPATYTQEGEEIRTCGTCGLEETRVIEKLPLPENIVITEPYTIAKVFDGFVIVSADTTVADLFAASNASAVLTATGEQAEPDTVLATGMQIVIFNGETIVDSVEIVVLGDVDGDGIITASDARTALRASVGLDTLNAAQQKSADTDTNATIASSDARDILRASVGLDDPVAWFEKIRKAL